MRMLDFKDEKNRYYFPLLCSVILEFSLVEFLSIRSAVCPYEDAQAAFDDTLDRIEDWVAQIGFAARWVAADSLAGMSASGTDSAGAMRPVPVIRHHRLLRPCYGPLPHQSN